MYKKLTSILIVLCFFTLYIQQCEANQKPVECSTQLCYGFILPLKKFENLTIENEIFCKTKHLINDLLREKIPVYWTQNNFTAKISEIKDIKNIYDCFIEKGSFIIPFSKDDFIDTKLTAIIFDYNQTSEIEYENKFRVEVYILRTPLNVVVCRLNDVKIVQYHNIVTGGEEHFLENARNCGFLNFDFITEKTINKKLDISRYNLFLCAGGVVGYSSFHIPLTACTNEIYEDIVYKGSKAIRKFVSEGGGYIGACHGAERAISGFYIGNIPINFKNRVYNPELKTLGSLALTDAIIKTNSNWTGFFPEIKIMNQTHPVTYGLEKISVDRYAGGPHFKYIGENSEEIARLHNFNHFNMNNSACWVSSIFGNGKVVIYSTHPEALCWREDLKKVTGHKVISNSYYYTTSEEKDDININSWVNFSFIKNIWNKTAILTGNMGKSEVFSYIKNNINTTIFEIDNLTLIITELLKKICDVKEDTSNNFLGYDSVNEVIFYINLFKSYLENGTKTFDIFEKIYQLLYNDSVLKNNLNDLLSNISVNLNRTRDVCSDIKNLCKEYENKLKLYNKTLKRILRIGANFIKLMLKDNAFKIYRESVKGFHCAHKVYFDSLKFMRSSWYDYETYISM
jgi:hypothetical protein